MKITNSFRPYYFNFLLIVICFMFCINIAGAAKTDESSSLFVLHNPFSHSSSPAFIGGNAWAVQTSSLFQPQTMPSGTHALSPQFQALTMPSGTHSFFPLFQAQTMPSGTHALSPQFQAQTMPSGTHSFFPLFQAQTIPSGTHALPPLFQAQTMPSGTRAFFPLFTALPESNQGFPMFNAPPERVTSSQFGGSISSTLPFTLFR